MDHQKMQDMTNKINLIVATAMSLSNMRIQVVVVNEYPDCKGAL